MTVTILVPIYGVEQYIEQCAISLFDQTYQNIEYVFCDDCSPDCSIEILKEVVERYPERKAHIKLIRNEYNLGLGGSRKHLLEELKSDFFCLVDSDDLLPQTAVEMLVKRMKETDADIIEGAYKEYSDNDLGEAILPFNGNANDYFKKALCQNVFPLRVWGKLYKTAVLKKVPNMFFKGIDFAEDVCATSQLIAVTSRAYTNEVVYLYRTDNNTSYTKNISEKNILSYFRAMKEVLRFYQLRGPLPVCLEIGILNVYRECHRSAISVNKADEILQYHPEHPIAKILYKLLHFDDKIFPFTDFIYRSARAFYIL